MDTKEETIELQFTDVADDKEDDQEASENSETEKLLTQTKRKKKRKEKRRDKLEREHKRTQYEKTSWRKILCAMGVGFVLAGVVVVFIVVFSGLVKINVNTAAGGAGGVTIQPTPSLGTTWKPTLGPYVDETSDTMKPTSGPHKDPNSGDQDASESETMEPTSGPHKEKPSSASESVTMKPTSGPHKDSQVQPTIGPSPGPQPQPSPQPTKTSVQPAPQSASGLRSADEIDAMIGKFRKRMRELCEVWPPKNNDDTNCVFKAHLAAAASDGGLALKQKLRQSITKTKKFTFAFAGASPTAGADLTDRSVRVDRVYAAEVTPMLALLGVEVFTQNQAMQGVKSFPLSFCFESMLSPDVDVVSYDWVTFGETECTRDMYYRSVRALPSQPVLFFMSGFQGDSPLAGFWSWMYFVNSKSWTASMQEHHGNIKKLHITQAKKQQGWCTLQPPQGSGLSNLTNCYTQDIADLRTIVMDTIAKMDPAPPFKTFEETKAYYQEFLSFAKSLYTDQTPEAVIEAARHTLWDTYPPPPPDPAKAHCHNPEMCQMAAKYDGFYYFDERTVSEYISWEFEMLFGLTRNAHHPGEWSHFFEGSSFAYFIYQMVIYVLADMKAGLPASSEPYTAPTNVLPPADAACRYPLEKLAPPRHSAQFCLTATRPAYERAQLLPQSMTDWEYVQVNSDRSVDSDIDHKNYYSYSVTKGKPIHTSSVSVAPVEPGEVLTQRFQVHSVPAILLLCSQWWRKDMEGAEFAVDGSSTFTPLSGRRLFDGGDGVVLKETLIEGTGYLQWGGKDGLCYFAGQHDDWAIGEHTVSIRASSSQTHDLEFGWLLVL